MQSEWQASCQQPALHQSSAHSGEIQAQKVWKRHSGTDVYAEFTQLQRLLRQYQNNLSKAGQAGSAFTGHLWRRKNASGFEYLHEVRNNEEMRDRLAATEVRSLQELYEASRAGTCSQAISVFMVVIHACRISKLQVCNRYTKDDTVWITIKVTLLSASFSVANCTASIGLHKSNFLDFTTIESPGRRGFR